MALTPSTMLALGTLAPNFILPDVVSGNMVSLEDFKNKEALLVMFICRHCPYVQHIKEEIAKIGQDYKEKNIAIIAISANDINSYPQDSPENLKEMAEELNFSFPYLYDKSQEIAKAYTAACTPDFFLFDKNRKLVYRGQLDNSRPGNNLPVTGKDLREAMDAVLEDKPINPDQNPSMAKHGLQYQMETGQRVILLSNSLNHFKNIIYS